MYLSKKQRWALGIALDAMERMPEEEEGKIASDILIDMLQKAEKNIITRKNGEMSEKDVELLNSCSQVEALNVQKNGIRVLLRLILSAVGNRLDFW